MAPSVTSTPSPLPTTGVPGAQAAPPAPAAAPTSGGNAAISTGYSSSPANFGTDVTDAVTRLTAFAQDQMKATQDAIQAEFSSEGEPLNAAKLQIYSQRMSMYEMSMQMAAKIQEKEENAKRVWTQP
jgi:hypothetical protein